mgnify:CR=1 FL=1
MKHESLFSAVKLGGLTLKNRIVFPPLTRQRSAQTGDVASDLMATYYGQRASAGFMVSEGTQIEPRGQGYAWTPGIYTPEQIDGWRKVTDAVHAEGGVIFAQLWHVGRVSHHALQPDGSAPIAPSAIQTTRSKAFIETGVPIARPGLVVGFYFGDLPEGANADRCTYAPWDAVQKVIRQRTLN